MTTPTTLKTLMDQNDVVIVIKVVGVVIVVCRFVYHCPLTRRCWQQ